MSQLITLLGTIGSWLGSIAAQATALIIAYMYKRVSTRYPELLPSPSPNPLDSTVRDLAAAVEANQVALHASDALLLEAVKANTAQPKIIQDLMLDGLEPSRFE
ncbi:MAG: hypothetical protein Q9200_005219, partial [Gallowayella weberi]